MAGKKTALAVVDAAPKTAADSLINFLNSMGTEKDPTTGYLYTFTELDRGQLNLAYRGSWLAKKIVDVPAKDSTAKWRRWHADQADIEKIETVEKKFDLQRKTKKAMIRARLFGGAGMVMGVDDGLTSDQPLDLTRVKLDGLKYVHVMSKHELKANNPITDPQSEWFGQPSSFEVTVTQAALATVNGATVLQQSQLIHPSRVVQFLGDEVPDTFGSTTTDFWRADSVLQAADDAIRGAGIVTGGLSALIGDMKFDVIQVPGLTSQMGDKDYKARLLERFAVANLAKGMCNALLMDKEEGWNRIQTTLTGLPDVVRTFMELCGGAASIPISRLIGPGQVGLGGNASGETDLVNYYDDVTTNQETVMTPAMMNLDECVIRSATGKDDDSIYYTWNPLRELTEKQEADMALVKAQTAEKISGLALFNEDAFRDAYGNTLIEDETFAGLEQAFDEHGIEPDEPQQPTLGTTELRAMAAAGVTPALPPGTPGSALKPGAPKPGAAPKTGAKPAVVPFKKAAGDAAPRTLYVRRDVLNGDEIKAWAKDQGFPTTVPAEEMHVTICYSNTPVDWTKTGSDWGVPMGSDASGNMVIPAGGMRMLDKMGNAIALLFNSSSLCWRNESLKNAGATSDYQDYQPHISLTFDPGQFDWREAEPYQGKIELGPEIYEEVKNDESWRTTFTEDAAYTATRGQRMQLVKTAPKRKRKPKAK